MPSEGCASEKQNLLGGGGVQQRQGLSAPAFPPPLPSRQGGCPGRELPWLTVGILAAAAGWAPARAAERSPPSPRPAELQPREVPNCSPRSI